MRESILVETFFPADLIWIEYPRRIVKFRTDISKHTWISQSALSWVFHSLLLEVASIVKSNMGDQPSLPRNLENMVRQEYRKEHARERLRKKHELRNKVKSSSQIMKCSHNRRQGLGFPNYAKYKRSNLLIGAIGDRKYFWCLQNTGGTTRYLLDSLDEGTSSKSET